MSPALKGPVKLTGKQRDTLKTMRRQNGFCAKLNSVYGVWGLRGEGEGGGRDRERRGLMSDGMSPPLGWRTAEQSPAAVSFNELLGTCLCFSCCLATLILALEMVTAGNNFFKG